MENTNSKRREISKALEFCLIATVTLSTNVRSQSRMVSVKDSSEFSRAITELAPGTTIAKELSKFLLTRGWLIWYK
ncbi:MAG: hypothetical protein JSW47_01360 [Phycisphaerales bacterium]|nr:MAG: hypothetical protein JSW47_01360 [Phycisphaerales bacterium]